MMDMDDVRSSAVVVASSRIPVVWFPIVTSVIRPRFFIIPIDPTSHRKPSLIRGYLSSHEFAELRIQGCEVIPDK
jgi:hypothetical protein